MSENPLPQYEYQVYDPERREISVVVVHPSRPRYWLHALLFLTTFLSTLSIGAHLQDDFNRNVWPYSDDQHFLPWSWGLEDYHRLPLGLPFSLCLMGILGAHEFGHYILCRRRGVLATLPYFIPFPSLVGTVGAVIRIRSPIPNRKDLFDIGIAGPIAGFVVAVPILMFSLLHSKPITVKVEDSWPVLGLPLIFHLTHWLLNIFGSQAAAIHANVSQLYLSPTAIAAWVGMLATALNLIPGGQLDGGHIVFALNPRAHRWVSRLCILVLLGMTWFSITWLLWAVVLGVTLTRYPIVPLEPGLPRRSRVLSLTAALMLLLTFTPTPIKRATLKDFAGSVKQAIYEYRHPSKQ